MTRLLISGGVALACLIALSLGVVDQPCNLTSDCSSGECCGLVSGQQGGSQGVCRAHLLSFQECDPNGPKDGHCGCPPHSFCRSEGGGVPRCHYIMG